MTLPLTPQPNRLQESVAASKSTSTQIFGVMYITFTGLIDSMVPVSGTWAVLGKLLPYIVKLAPIMWWALPAGPAGRLPASSQEPPLVGSLTLSIRIDNLLPQEIRAQGWDSNPEPTFLWAAGPWTKGPLA
ncbi:hypothetical protein DSO57_1005238 [Entomophthora muscae]|uniref:Uncharacterized protein n=1 Tax=Entomophthora muscae TaxID=34485 RepID=A0ACC2U5S6_9FUNG|nr:hypothetical protein DSO57_1005238 [Entomophthora muscae]